MSTLKDEKSSNRDNRIYEELVSEIGTLIELFDQPTWYENILSQLNKVKNKFEEFTTQTDPAFYLLNIVYPFHTCFDYAKNRYPNSPFSKSLLSALSIVGKDIKKRTMPIDPPLVRDILSEPKSLDTDYQEAVESLDACIEKIWNPVGVTATFSATLREAYESIAILSNYPAYHSKFQKKFEDIEEGFLSYYNLHPFIKETLLTFIDTCKEEVNKSQLILLSQSSSSASISNSSGSNTTSAATSSTPEAHIKKSSYEDSIQLYYQLRKALMELTTRKLVTIDKLAINKLASDFNLIKEKFKNFKNSVTAEFYVLNLPVLCYLVGDLENLNPKFKGKIYNLLFRPFIEEFAETVSQINPNGSGDIRHLFSPGPKPSMPVSDKESNKAIRLLTKSITQIEKFAEDYDCQTKILENIYQQVTIIALSEKASFHELCKKELDRLNTITRQLRECHPFLEKVFAVFIKHCLEEINKPLESKFSHTSGASNTATPRESQTSQPTDKKNNPKKEKLSNKSDKPGISDQPPPKLSKREQEKKLREELGLSLTSKGNRESKHRTQERFFQPLKPSPTAPRITYTAAPVKPNTTGNNPPLSRHHPAVLRQKVPLYPQLRWRPVNPKPGSVGERKRPREYPTLHITDQQGKREVVSILYHSSAPTENKYPKSSTLTSHPESRTALIPSESKTNVAQTPPALMFMPESDRPSPHEPEFAPSIHYNPPTHYYSQLPYQPAHTYSVPSLPALQWQHPELPPPPQSLFFPGVFELHPSEFSSLPQPALVHTSPPQGYAVSPLPSLSIDPYLAIALLLLQKKSPFFDMSVCHIQQLLRDILFQNPLQFIDLKDIDENDLVGLFQTMLIVKEKQKRPIIVQEKIQLDCRRLSETGIGWFCAAIEGINARELKLKGINSAQLITLADQFPRNKTAPVLTLDLTDSRFLVDEATVKAIIKLYQKNTQLVHIKFNNKFYEYLSKNPKLEQRVKTLCDRNYAKLLSNIKKLIDSDAVDKLRECINERSPQLFILLNESLSQYAAEKKSKKCSRYLSETANRKSVLDLTRAHQRALANDRAEIADTFNSRIQPGRLEHPLTSLPETVSIASKNKESKEITRDVMSAISAPPGFESVENYILQARRLFRQLQTLSLKTKEMGSENFPGGRIASLDSQFLSAGSPLEIKKLLSRVSVDKLLSNIKAGISSDCVHLTVKKGDDLSELCINAKLKKEQDSPIQIKEKLSIDCKELTKEEIKTFCEAIKYIEISKLELTNVTQSQLDAFAEYLIENQNNYPLFELDFMTPAFLVNLTTINAIAKLYENNMGGGIHINFPDNKQLQNLLSDDGRIKKLHQDSKAIFVEEIQNLIDNDDVARLHHVFCNQSLCDKYPFLSKDLLEYAAKTGKLNCVNYFLNNTRLKSPEKLFEAYAAAYSANPIEVADPIGERIKKDIPEKFHPHLKTLISTTKTIIPALPPLKGTLSDSKERKPKESSSFFSAPKPIPEKAKQETHKESVVGKNASFGIISREH